MRIRAKQDLIAGLFVLSLGVAVTIYSASVFDIGTPRRMGPGFFPLCLGICMIVFGLPMTVFGARSEPIPMQFDVRPFVAILVSMAIFALVLPQFGLLPATVLLVVISLLAGRLPGRIALLLTTVGVTALAILVFRVGLNTQLAILHWPL